MAEKTVLEAIKFFKMLENGDSILISISGGPDSTFLTHILYDLRDEFNLTLYGFCLDHVTRGGRSTLDAAFVKRMCRKLDIRLFSEKIDAKKWCSTSKLSFQAGARELRASRLEEISSKYNITKIAVGHNSDDNIETFLMRLIRGAGARGLSGIKPVSGKVIRPLITTSRADIMQYLEDHGTRYCVDHTNLEDVYFRNRVRNKLIPFISENFFKNFRSSVLRSIEILRDEDTFLRKYTANLLEDIARFSRSRDGKNIIYIKIPIEPILSSSVAIRRRLISSAMERILGHLEDISFKNIYDVLALLPVERGGENKWLQPIRSLRVLRINGFIHMIDLDHLHELPREIRNHIFEGHGTEDKKISNSKIKTKTMGGTFPLKGTGSPEGCNLKVLQGGDLEIKIGGEAELIQFSMMLKSELVDADPGMDYKKALSSQAFIDYDRVKPPVRVRSWNDGDRFYPLGAGGSKKLQDLFMDSKIPVNKRANIPVFYDREKIIWVGNLRIDQRVRVTGKTCRILRLELFEK
ncbi:MAG: tRNA lysidine(34) synthetase TilS [Actinobacteria bacterium]|nr:tRNA lysidine(34) synthetase TilS [Actinomycetota bacterium]